MSLPPFQALLDAHAGELYRFLAATAGPGDADDCFQETAIAALRAYPDLRLATNLRGWLFRIAERKALDAHRARGRRALPVAEVPQPIPVAAAADRSAPVAAAAELDGEPALWDQVRELPPKQRTGVYCRSVLGMPYGELAAVLDCSEDAARRSVHEGLKRLREQLGVTGGVGPAGGPSATSRAGRGGGPTRRPSATSQDEPDQAPRKEPSR